MNHTDNIQYNNNSNNQALSGYTTKWDRLHESKTPVFYQSHRQHTIINELSSKLVDTNI